MTQPREMFRSLPWPFENDRFPDDLGAVVQRTILDRGMPPLLVGHTPRGEWYVGDGVNDPNEPGASIATHLAHVIERDPSIEGLAGLPPGHEARRRDPMDPWQVAAVELDP